MEKGFQVYKNFLNTNDRQTLLKACENHFFKWQELNEDFYKSHAINSAYCTDPKWCSQEDRLLLLKYISSIKINTIAKEIFKDKAYSFLNSQLFFNPFHKEKKNYWHRDGQYANLTVEELKDSVENRFFSVIHLRLALKYEPGIDVIPYSHKNWDNEEELKVRMEIDGHKNYEDLSRGEKIPLNAGDLLVFDASMIHRGLYGMKRMSLDILFSLNDRDILKFRSPECLPTKNELQHLEITNIF